MVQAGTKAEKEAVARSPVSAITKRFDKRHVPILHFLGLAVALIKTKESQRCSMKSNKQNDINEASINHGGEIGLSHLIYARCAGLPMCPTSQRPAACRMAQCANV